MDGSRLLVTGGAGYIGSHVLVALAAAGHRPVALDNFSNGSRRAVEAAESICGGKIPLLQGDIRTPGLLQAVFNVYERRHDPIRCVVHLAGCKAVGESVANPLKYYDNNVHGTTILLCAMQECGVRKLVFSSSATVYGAPRVLPITETHPFSPANPYGRSKRFVEMMCEDLCAAHEDWGVVSLRYFNPIGAHSSGNLGECPQDEPANLFPYITQVAVGRRKRLTIFGNDYDTPDGTGVRDYLHVMDLARGHLKAVHYLLKRPGMLAVNLGTGQGTSVLQLISAFERVSGKSVPCAMHGRRPGDIASMWADPARAWQALGWRAELDLDRMCADGWRWQSQNPLGYDTGVAPRAVPPRRAGHATPINGQRRPA